MKNRYHTSSAVLPMEAVAATPWFIPGHRRVLYGGGASATINADSRKLDHTTPHATLITQRRASCSGTEYR